MKEKSEQKLLSIEGAMEYCGVSRNVIYRWIADDGLPIFRVPGRGTQGIIRIHRDDLQKWLGQFRHDFSRKEKKPKKIQLTGRRFLNPNNTSGKWRTRLDANNEPASRVQLKEDTE